MHYVLIKPGHPLTETVIVTRDSYVVVIPDDENPYDVDPRTAADNPAYTIIPLIEQLEWEDNTEVLHGRTS